MKRQYLRIEGQRLVIRIEGASGTGKTQLTDKIYAILKADGLLVESTELPTLDRLIATAPSAKQVRDAYLETLGAHEVETLRGHLAALGYEL